MKTGLKPLSLFLLLVEQLLITRVVSFLLISIVLLTSSKLYLVSLAHLSQLFIVGPLLIAFGILKSGLPVFEIYLLNLDLGLDTLDIFLSCEERVLHLGLILIL